MQGNCEIWIYAFWLWPWYEVLAIIDSMLKRCYKSLCLIFEKWNRKKQVGFIVLTSVFCLFFFYSELSLTDTWSFLFITSELQFSMVLHFRKFSVRFHSSHLHAWSQSSLSCTGWLSSAEKETVEFFGLDLQEFTFVCLAGHIWAPHQLTRDVLFFSPRSSCAATFVPIISVNILIWRLFTYFC